MRYRELEGTSVVYKWGMCARIITRRHLLTWLRPSVVCICSRGREYGFLIIAFLITSIVLALCKVHYFYNGTELGVVKRL